MIALAYIGFFTYMTLIVALGEIIKKAFKIEAEMVRKIQHILTAPCWVILYFTIGISIHGVIIAGIGTALLAFITFSHLFKAVERNESNNYGVFYFGVSCFIVTLLCYLFFPEYYILVGITYFCLSFADGFAPIFAKLAGKHNREIRKGKSVVGCATVFLFAFLVILVFKYAAHLEFTYLYMLSFAVLFMMVEYYGYLGSDNFFTVLIGCGYLLLEAYGLNNLALEVGLLFFPVLLILNMFKKSLTEMGLFVAAICAIVASYFGGMPLFLSFLILFLTNAIVVGIVKHVLRKKGREVEHSKPRNAWQILTNALTATVLAFLSFFFYHDIFVIAAVVVIAEEFGDSMASDIGRYQKRRPLDIIRFKRVEPGLSGGVSLLGTCMALIAVLGALLILPGFDLVNVGTYFICGAVAFGGVFVDSILGSLIQNKNKCTVCGAITEEDIHCDVPTVHESGWKFVSNRGVNMITSVVTAGIALLVLFII